MRPSETDLNYMRPSETRFTEVHSEPREEGFKLHMTPGGNPEPTSRALQDRDL